MTHSSLKRGGYLVIQWDRARVKYILYELMEVDEFKVK
jgi:hypothetical protein